MGLGKSSPSHEAVSRRSPFKDIFRMDNGDFGLFAAACHDYEKVAHHSIPCVDKLDSKSFWATETLGLPELTTASEAVIHGKVCSKKVARDSEGRIYTTIGIEILEVWKEMSRAHFGSGSGRRNPGRTEGRISIPGTFQPGRGNGDFLSIQSRRQGGHHWPHSREIRCLFIPRYGYQACTESFSWWPAASEPLFPITNTHAQPSASLSG